MSLSLKLRKYWTVGAVSLDNRLAYPASFVAAMLTYGLFVFVYSRIWTTVYADQALIAAYSHPMAVWYFIVAEVSVFGFGRLYWSLSQDIKSGQVALLLARPYDFTFYHFNQALWPALVEVGLLLVLGFFMGVGVAGWPPFLIGQPLLVLQRGLVLMLSLLLAGCLQFFLQFAIALTAFWFEENAAFFWIYQKIALIAGTLLPLEFLPKPVQALTRLTPFPWLSWAPARLAVAPGVENPWCLLAVQAAWTGAAWLFCRLLFAAGRTKITVNGG